MDSRFQLAAFVLVGNWMEFAQGQPAQSGLPQHSSKQSSILVVVRDENHDLVSGARVTLTVPGSSFSLVVETDFAGHYRFYGMMPGKYALEVERKGFYPVSVGVLEFAPDAEIPVRCGHVYDS